MSETEQNKTEEPTDFKLTKAREKGQVAKGQDFAFFGLLVALAIYAVAAGPKTMRDLTQMMRNVFSSSIGAAHESSAATAAIKSVYLPIVQSLSLLGVTLFITVALVQLIQIRGFIFTTHPIKPDFSKLNPGKGLKRIFSMKTLKEAIKNIFKMSVYLGSTYLLILYCIKRYLPTLVDADSLILAMHGGGMRLLYMYAALALFFTALDQIIVRKEFTKQMRMSKSEVEREHKDREGEPRLKQKRKQLHKEYIKQTQGTGNLPGSDLIIVNPEHFAVAVVYDAETMKAPQVTTKGRNKFALDLKQRAFELSIPIIQSPKLARALFKHADAGQEVPSQYYQSVADIYIRLYNSKGAGAQGRTADDSDENIKETRTTHQADKQAGYDNEEQK